MVERVGGKETLDLGRSITLFIGPEGAGKTEQGKPLAKNSGKPYITTGDMIRELAANDPGSLGEKCREMQRKGVYLDGVTLLKVLGQRISKEDCKDGFVLDGGLRTLEETIGFRNMLKEANRDFALNVVYLQITEDETYKRLLTGPNARKRKDDTPELIANRLNAFKLNLSERLDIIKNEPGWRLHEIDAMPDASIVYFTMVDSLMA